MGLRLFFLPNFPGATFIQGATFISESRVSGRSRSQKNLPTGSQGCEILRV